ncbi:formylglycine-generating enzyme family protein [Telluribacter humicola]|uniref:formylglycine-generating enzyme family protein n=1 Tax=Telluribacter humicola TaxID=1720261 RepID=UPI001A96838E|nr:SUMF1/EgtB/PvdO family nonheme iron enzyme [Telluribacter humicola]
MPPIDLPAIRDLMVEIPEGYVEMRDDRTKTKWTAQVRAFFLAKYPVTQEFYHKITYESPSSFKGSHRPVETVSWKDAVVFCNTLSSLTELTPCYTLLPNEDKITFDPTANGFRLPTEAEWQYACQAGTRAITYGELDQIAWYKANSSQQTQDVGQKQPNAWGLYDMLGNVWEWCSDIYDEEVYGSYRVFRGGGWYDEERSVMATTRRRSHPISFRIDDLGFRIARNSS